MTLTFDPWPWKSISVVLLWDDHLILKGGWHFLEINILTIKMLEINNMSCSGKKINNLTLTCYIFVEFGGKVQFLKKKNSSPFTHDSSIYFFFFWLAKIITYSLTTVIFQFFLLASLAFNYNMNAPVPHIRKPTHMTSCIIQYFYLLSLDFKTVYPLVLS